MKISLKKLEEEYRRQLLSYAHGNILEIGVGSGNNFKYYPMGVNVTATDMSAKIIEKAKVEASAKGVKSNFIVSPLEDLFFDPQSFDTIVSTFSLSSYDNPVVVMNQFNEWCKPGGLVLLMEYGLSRNSVIGWFQKKLAPSHYKRTGCHVDRDMFRLISLSKLCVKRIETKYVGIVYLVWASLCRR
jgi:2-polyprenyl-3-methyl-5-hydroxy-6-metoxy-1,4-benzoquinol methylase